MTINRVTQLSPESAPRVTPIMILLVSSIHEYYSERMTDLSRAYGTGCLGCGVAFNDQEKDQTYE